MYEGVFFMECLENIPWHFIFDPLADRQNYSTMEQMQGKMVYV